MFGKMNFEFKLAWTYFRAKRKSLARFTTFAAIIGIACGVASLIIAQSLAQGFQTEIQDKILQNTAHIAVFRKDGSEINDFLRLKTKLEKLKNIKEINGTTYENSLIITDNYTNYAVLRGIPNSIFQIPNSKFQISNSDEINVEIGAELAEKMSLKIGDEADILLTSRKTSRVKIANIFRTGLYEYDSIWIYISFADLAKLKEREICHPTMLNIMTADIYGVKQTGESLRENLSDEYKIVDWQEANQPLFTALSLEKKVTFAVILLITLVASLNITTTLALLVSERRSDIAILRTCGAKTKSLMLIFLLEGLFLGLCGIIFGVILGLFLCRLSNYFKLISLNTEVYSLASVSLNPNAMEVLFIVLITFLISISATIFPAWKASKIKPLENLRLQ
jgi:lipoprotein-releasing system permease protein